jgi:diguanylate cyclase (GGDEF)-like protein/PAS domain S-box-containing protein
LRGPTSRHVATVIEQWLCKDGPMGGRRDRVASPDVAPVGGERSRLNTLYTSLAEESYDFIVAVRDDGSIGYANPAGAAFVGWPLDQIVGRSIFDLLHPDDVDRAVFDLSVHSERGAPGNTTYRVRRADGAWVPLHTVTADVTDGSRRMVATYSRPADMSTAEVLYRLLRGATTADALTPVLDMLNWRPFDSRVGISWSDHDGFSSVGTDLPAQLTGGDDATETPWAACRQDAKPRRFTDLAGLDDTRRALAERLGLAAYWVEPVLADNQVCAVITVWTSRGGPPPQYHSSGMSTARDYVELILRWTQQARLLDDAAHRDALTGLANRKAFFDSFGAEAGGAVLYCDLDRFKPVNDDLGHRAGDELLRAVARRIEGCVRTGDVVARLGGDEFGVLCEGATRQQAALLADRIRDAVTEPFQVMGATARIGISIGVAHSDALLGDHVLEAADHALYAAKAEGGGAVRFPEDDHGSG